MAKEKEINLEGTGKHNGHAFVDLGLPSGLLWATCNVGATNPEDCGDYFAWGETKPKEDYNYDAHKYCNTRIRDKQFKKEPVDKNLRMIH